MNNYEKFQNSLKSWCEALDRARKDAMEILSKGNVILKENDSLNGPYFFISVERCLYLHAARLDENNEIVVYAGSEEDGPSCYTLSWEDVSQDIPTVNDFMSALYEHDGLTCKD